MLADIQVRFRDALLSGDGSGIAPILVGGRAPSMRLKVHQRHYEASLTSALLDKFPATGWLVGSAFLTEVAQQFVRSHPPKAPCIAEYGESFPAFLAEYPPAEGVPYLRSFSELEWHVGHVSVAIDLPSIPIASLSATDAGAIPDVVLMLQPGVRYLETSWPVDDLLKLYLADSAPDQLVFCPADVLIEIRGARGEFRLNRLDRGAFAFRHAIATGRTVGAAAESALEASSDFDISAAFASLFAEGLVTSVIEPSA